MYFNLPYLFTSPHLSLSLSLPPPLFFVSQFNQVLEDLKAFMAKLIGLYSNQADPQIRVDKDTPQLFLSQHYHVILISTAELRGVHEIIIRIHKKTVPTSE